MWTPQILFWHLTFSSNVLFAEHGFPSMTPHFWSLAVGACYASLPPPKASQESDAAPALSRKGAEIIAGDNCASCHQGHYTGQQATPRLAGQREEYLLKALRDFKSGVRRGGGGGAMPSATYRLSNDDMTALAHDLARVQ